MTGYGSSEGRVGKGVVFVEVRSVNSRFLDINCKLPFSMFPIEGRIKKALQGRMIRGKAEVFMKEKKEIAETFELTVNHRLVGQYKKCLGDVNRLIGRKTSSHLLEVMDLKDLVVHRDKHVNIERFWSSIEKVLNAALVKCDAMRKREGVAIEHDQLKRLSLLTRLISSIEGRAKARDADMRGRLEKEATDQAASGVSSALERLDITEELTRLKSHISQYRALIKKKGAIGRQLDFLIQEMHREVNTLGSKACDGEISGFVVDTKAEVEKLREQVQNVE